MIKVSSVPSFFREGITQTIDNLAATGQVSLKGQTWTARGRDNVPLEPGTRVTVLAIEGVKVIVQPIE